MSRRQKLVWIFGLVVVCVLVLGVWRASRAMNKFTAIETTFQSLTQRNFRLTRGLRTRTNRLHTAAMRYAVTQDVDYQQRFETTRDDLARFLTTQLPLFERPDENHIVAEMEGRLEEYVVEAKTLMEKTGDVPEREVVRGLLSSVEKAREALDQLGELASTLSETRVDSLRDDLLAYHQSVRALQWTMFVSIGMLLLSALLLVWLARRAFVNPLQQELAEARELVSKKEALANLGTMAAAIVHEIRNPITTMRARIFALEELLGENESARKQACAIEGQVDRLERMSEGFLAFARPADAQRREISLSKFLRDVVATETHLVSSNGGRLVTGKVEDATVRIDSSQMHQALANLIRNASEAAPEGEVEITAHLLDADNVRVSVRDHGPGIADDMRPNLFVPFKTDKPTGSGLGLPMVKSLVELQGGELSYETDPGKGTVFHIDLNMLV